MKASVIGGPSYTNIKTAGELINRYPGLEGKDGYYLLYPQGESRPPRLVYCDMTTDGGGWMLIARTHITAPDDFPSSGWGWQGEQIGDVKDFTQPYQAGWAYWKDHATFSEMMWGNRKNINNHDWGSHIYKFGNVNSNYLKDSNNTQRRSGADVELRLTRTVIKNTTSVYSHAGFYEMAQHTGHWNQGTDGNVYWIKDNGGFNANVGGIKPTQIRSYHYNSYGPHHYTGPWSNNTDDVDADGNFLGDLPENSFQVFNADGENPKTHGGTDQCMIFVR